MKIDEIVQLKDAALREAAAAPDAQALEEVRIKYLGRKGMLPEIMKGLKDLDPANRPVAGQKANELKNELTDLVTERKAEFESAGSQSSPGEFDATLPGQWHRLGSRHPITQITERITEIFHNLGFTVAEGPDIETVYHNFDALNTPEDHPSRDMQDTFYLENGDLLRCHTSPVQVRYMETHKPPVRIIAPGRCYRRDTPDATHSANFHQVEGLYIDKDVSLADLKGDLSYFAQQLMGPDVKIRFRPHFFPFTEPSVEVDFTCHVCHGKGCRVCKNSGWIEILGAGMVDPNVFKAVGYDEYDVTGYAFGMGIERIAMILFGIQDIRHLYENDVRFLAQFG
ncbi:MAG: phenylalanine--tRNA ligase subunit alpha [Verrucomicrobia bacterium]|nr:phenylalanine--tRNA ligase subunit alpha [Verrucomicrobiota bacterium]